jgi:hypothetical protein
MDGSSIAIPKLPQGWEDTSKVTNNCTTNDKSYCIPPDCKEQMATLVVSAMQLGHPFTLQMHMPKTNPTLNTLVFDLDGSKIMSFPLDLFVICSFFGRVIHSLFPNLEAKVHCSIKRTLNYMFTKESNLHMVVKGFGANIETRQIVYMKICLEIVHALDAANGLFIENPSLDDLPEERPKKKRGKNSLIYLKKLNEIQTFDLGGGRSVFRSEEIVDLSEEILAEVDRQSFKLMRQIFALVETPEEADTNLFDLFDPQPTAGIFLRSDFCLKHVKKADKKKATTEVVRVYVPFCTIHYGGGATMDTVEASPFDHRVLTSLRATDYMIQAWMDRYILEVHEEVHLARDDLQYSNIIFPQFFSGSSRTPMDILMANTLKQLAYRAQSGNAQRARLEENNDTFPDFPATGERLYDCVNPMLPRRKDGPSTQLRLWMTKGYAFRNDVPRKFQAFNVKSAALVALELTVQERIPGFTADDAVLFLNTTTKGVQQLELDMTSHLKCQCPMAIIPSPDRAPHQKSIHVARLVVTFFQNNATFKLGCTHSRKCAPYMGGIPLELSPDEKLRLAGFMKIFIDANMIAGQPIGTRIALEHQRGNNSTMKECDAAGQQIARRLQRQGYVLAHEIRQTALCFVQSISNG